MKFKSFLIVLTMLILLAACAPRSTPTENPTLVPVMTETAESMETATLPTEGTTGSSAPTEAALVTSAMPPTGNVFEVEISGFAFEENSITIKTGDTVIWTNHDSAPHTIVADDGSFKSNSLNNDASFSQTFENAGTYPYHCGIHASMTGTVIVEP